MLHLLDGVRWRPLAVIRPVPHGAAAAATAAAVLMFLQVATVVTSKGIIV